MITRVLELFGISELFDFSNKELLIFIMGCIIAIVIYRSVCKFIRRLKYKVRKITRLPKRALTNFIKAFVLGL